MEIIRLKNGALLDMEDDSFVEKIEFAYCGLDDVYINDLILKFRNLGVVKCKFINVLEDYSILDGATWVSVGDIIKLFVVNYKHLEQLTEEELPSEILRLLKKQDKFKYIRMDIIK